MPKKIPAAGFKKNVVTHEFSVPVRNKKTSLCSYMKITAETFEAAKLMIPEGYVLDED